ncbi:MAG: hypothetical protein K9M98_14285 [Cephaloticoccus sp.]|nr:hypothetical protein [Cephaloticoccus sp.]
MQLTPGDAVFMHSILFLKLDKSVAHHIAVSVNSSEDAALGVAIRDALAKYPDFHVAGVAPAKFYVDAKVKTVG